MSAVIRRRVFLLVELGRSTETGQSSKKRVLTENRARLLQPLPPYIRRDSRSGTFRAAKRLFRTH